MTKLHDLNKLGQSIWYDNIQRSLIDSGELQALLDAGVMGITSNPSIFEKAIAGSSDYDDAIRQLAAGGKDEVGIYEALAIEDIQRAADMLRSIYDETNRLDGYVSLEVSPTLAHDTGGTIAEARRLFAAVDRENVMIKVPATPAGIPAIETLISDGININVTLIFSLTSYEDVAGAYIAGLRKLAAIGGDVSKVASVASFFISRVDVAVDKALDAVDNSELQGKIGIANAKAAYGRFQEIFSGSVWDTLAGSGATPQRPLWASTGTKNPAYPDTLYIDELIGPQTVNTVPPKTLDAFRDHGTVAAPLADGIDVAQAQLAQLRAAGVDLDQITQELQDAGVASFAKSFESLMSSVLEKRSKLQQNWDVMKAELGKASSAVDAAASEMKADQVMQRIWSHDHTVWKPEPDEITNRLGWLHAPTYMVDHLDQINEVVDAVRADGYTNLLLLGMGGSSLAPEVFKLTFGVTEGYLDLAILDSTDPGTVASRAAGLDLSKTLFVVATKSGGTVETLSFFKYFYNQVVDAVGVDQAGAHFVAITDPGSKLVTLAEKYSFRHTFLNDPNIGGRYSALSFFGLVPASLLGVDVEKLLARAQTAACNSQSSNCPVDGNNNGARLGLIMGELAKIGRDKVTLIASSQLESFGNWVEQLIAESTGKDGVGILPVVGEAVGEPGLYGDDRLFVHLKLTEDGSQDAAVAALAAAGHPVVTIVLDDLYEMGAQFFLWEMATIVAGYRINIQPFDQPNVESAKILARQMVAAYMQDGELPASNSVEPSAAVLVDFLSTASAGDYVALQAYVEPTAEVEAALNNLRLQIREQHKVATTVGYGPRFLHSTGQLHKGDGGNGLFIQFVSSPVHDLDIPDEAGKSESGMTFGVLKNAQALGDGQALVDENRRFVRFDLGSDVLAGLDKLKS